MGIDKETELQFCVVLDKDKKLLEEAERNDIEICGKEEHIEKPQYWLSDDISSFNVEEYYFDESENKIHYAGEATIVGKKVYISVDIPLSDVVLIDIIAHSIKKLGKLKSALESLK